MSTNKFEETPSIGSRNFRHSPDIENFYRFIHENELRREAKKVLQFIHNKITAEDKKKSRRSKKVQ